MDYGQALLFTWQDCFKFLYYLHGLAKQMQAFLGAATALTKLLHYS